MYLIWFPCHWLCCCPCLSIHSFYLLLPHVSRSLVFIYVSMICYFELFIYSFVIFFFYHIIRYFTAIAIRIHCILILVSRIIAITILLLVSLCFLISCALLQSSDTCVRPHMPKHLFCYASGTPCTSPLQTRLLSFVPCQPKASSLPYAYKHLKCHLSLSTVATHDTIYFCNTHSTIILVNTY